MRDQTQLSTEIPTWLHGCIDYTVAGLFAAATTSRSLTPAVRQTFGVLGATHTSYAAVTDYEWGVKPWLSMRQHLVLDTCGGLALLAAGLLLRREPSDQRALLMTAGMLELGVVAFSSANPKTGPEARQEPVTYHPLDTPKPVANDVFVVDSSLPGVMGKVLPVRMTVIRLPDGTLLLHSPTRFTEPLSAALRQLGPIAHIVAPNIAHWTLLKPWQAAFPNAMTWAAPGLRDRRQVQRSGIRLDYDLGTQAPRFWGDAIDLIMVAGGGGFHEAILFHRASRTVILTDLVVNLEPIKIPPLMRPLVRLFGSSAPDGMPPPYLRFAIRLLRQSAVQAVEKMLALEPEKAIFSHGRYFDSNATQQLRHSFRWLLR